MRVNYFRVLELPEQLSIDLQDLERRFYALSRKWHPDRFARATAQEQQTALDTSALLNDGYRTLRHPVSRAEYFLAEKGVAAGDAKKVPPELLEEVFELNMALEELKSGDTDSLPQLRQALARFQEMLSQADSELDNDFQAWDQTASAAVLDRLRATLNRRKYISNLVRETGKALEHYVSD